MAKHDFLHRTPVNLVHGLPLLERQDPLVMRRKLEIAGPISRNRGWAGCCWIFVPTGFELLFGDSILGYQSRQVLPADSRSPLGAECPPDYFTF